MSFISRLLESIGDFFSHLFTGVENGFEQLPKEQQDPIIQGTNISQILKDGYKNGAEAVVETIATKLNVSTDVATGVVIQVGKDLGINTDKVQDVLDHIADQIQAGITDNAWNGLWQNVAKFAASWMSTGSVNWVTLSMGVIEFVLQKFVK